MAIWDMLDVLLGVLDLDGLLANPADGEVEAMDDIGPIPPK